MSTIDTLNKKFFSQNFPGNHPYNQILGRYKDIALCYAQMENAIAVLSDLRAKTSYIYYGKFAQTLGMVNNGKNDKISSIWEEEIFKLIHPDDLIDKHLQELCFFYFIKNQPNRKYCDYYLMSKLRMKTGTNSYIPALHRMFYIPVSSTDTLWLALCLYSPLISDFKAKSFIVNSINGNIIEPERQHCTRILSTREKQILNLINKGLTSKDIAEMLSISINTVSRHRQEILNKLRTKNSIEACRVAKELDLL